MSTPERGGLALPYVLLLVVEVAVLGTLVAMFGADAPARYELGYAAAASFVVMQLYSVVRRVRRVRERASLDAWLELHVFLGLQGFVFVIYHAIGIAPRMDLANTDAAVVLALVVTGMIGRSLFRHVASLRTEAIWSFLHRPLAFLLAALTSLHVLAHFAYAR